MKNILKTFLEFKLDDFKNHFDNQPKIIDDEIQFFLQQLFSSPSIIYTHSSKRQVIRDRFFTDLDNYLKSKGLDESQNFLNEKVSIIKGTEKIYGEILRSLEKCDVSKFAPEAQCWSHISRAENEIYKIWDLVHKKNADRAPNTPYIMSSAMFVENEDGEIFNPDSACEMIVNCLSLTLSMLTYTFGWQSGNKTSLPTRVAVTEEDEFKAGSVQLFAISWMKLEDLSNRSLLFGGKLLCQEGEEVADFLKVHKVESHYYFDRDESAFEVIDLISHDRFSKKLAQNFFEILFKSGISSFVVKELKDITSIHDMSFLSVDEFAAIHALSQTFGFDIFKDQSTYNGLTIREWIRGYATLKFICEKQSESKKGILYSKVELTQLLENGGLANASCENFIELTTFGKGSRDLFDCPLLLLQDGSYYLFSAAVISIQLTAVILSRMSSVEVQIKNKGTAFEDSILKLISDANLQGKAFRFYIDNQEYEFDAVFIFDKRVFILECKNRNLSGLNSVASFRKFKTLDETVEQVKRLVEGLKKRPNEFRKHFGHDLEQFEIVPVIVNSLAFSWPGEYKGVYITDYSALSRFFESRSITLSTIGNTAIKAKQEVHVLWQNEKPVSDDLLNQFESPPQIARYTEYLSHRLVTYIASKSTCFSINHLEINHKSMVEHESSESLKFIAEHLDR